MKYTKSILIVISMLLAYSKGFTQQPCGVSSHLANADHQLLTKLKSKYQRTKSDELKIIPMAAHAVTTSENYGSYLNQIKRGIDQVNAQFEGLNMRFMLCDDVNFISNDSFPNVVFETSNRIHRENNVVGAINMYMVEELDTGDGGRACGWATLPWWRSSGNDYIFMAENCMDDNTTLAHEIGHFLGLLHTHNVARLDSMIIDTMTMDTINVGIEFVDQSNCEIAGDMICDTPADPLLGFGNVNTSCEYTGTEQDPWGVPYSMVPPDATNRMSYARRSCMSSFSPTQIDIMHVWLAERTPELTCVGAREIKLLSFTSSVDDYVLDEDFELSWEISNYGFGQADISIDYRLYLSKNGIIDNSDILLYDTQDLSITKNGFTQNSFTVRLPIDYDQTGIHFLLLEMDPEKEHLSRSLSGKITIFLDASTSTMNTAKNEIQSCVIKPNPSSDAISIHSNHPNCRVSIFDQKGQIILKDYPSVQSIDIADFESGIYFIQIFSEKGKPIAFKKFVKI